MTCLAMDIGGTKIAAALVAPDGDIIGEVLTAHTPAHSPDAVLNQAIELSRALPQQDITQVAIASAGVIDHTTGLVLASTDSLQGWTGTQVGARVAEQLGRPTTVINDGHAFALGEAVYGAGADADSVLVVAVGTGVGGSYVRRTGGHREPLWGSRFGAGHLGHVPVAQASGVRCDCGQTGHLEAIGSGAGLARWYHAQGGKPLTAQQILARVDIDPLAARTIDLAAGAVGEAIAGLVNTLDPELVVLAGGITRAGDPWEAGVRSAFAGSVIKHLADTPIVISAADGWMSLRGAAYWAGWEMR